MGCGEFCVKYILFFANLFFALAGLTLLGLGVATQLQISAIAQHVDLSQIAPISAIVIGGIVFLIAFFGCCGAVRESNCMLVTYAVLMLLLMVMKIVFVVMIYVNIDSFTSQISTVLNEAFSRDPQAFQSIEQTFHCCGTTGPLSYGVNSVSLPNTCCANPPCSLLLGNNYAGCNDLIGDFVNVFGNAIGAVLVVIVAIELVAVIFGLCLANHVRNKYRRAHY